jgi:ATP-dependent DNA helicase RecG
LSEEIFPDLRVGVIHGKLTSKEKEKVMRSFRAGLLDILVANSVVEVGVDIPNASIMVIEGGERFGLATLHQFRGRVGRKGQEAYCFVFTSSSDEGSGLRRLRALEGTKTGFELAEYDLQYRGPGELAGRRQWGVSDIGMEALKNIKMVEAARSEAKRLLEEDETLSKYPLLSRHLKARAQQGEHIHFE